MSKLQSAAYAALESLIETPQFAPPYSDRKTAQEEEAARKTSAQGVRKYWDKYRGLSRDERLFAILRDDNGQWLEAASIIVQPTNKPVMPLVSWGYPWGLPLDFADATRMLGEPLRVKENPSVTELLIKRIHNALERGKDSADDAGALNGACNLAFCLTKWDGQAGLGVLQELCACAFQKLAPTHYSSLCSHMDLAGHLSALIQLRAKAGDTNALREYALWLKAVEPQHFFLQIGPMLTPLARFPDSPAWTGLWELLFDDEKSALFNYLLGQNRPDPKRMISPSLNVEVFFGTPVINNARFRKFAIRLLQEKSACGKIVGEAAHGYRLDQRLSVMRRFGYTVEGPKDGSEINGKEFRTCDFYAWLLSNRIKDAPEFQLYWPEAKRDKAIDMLWQLLVEGGAFNMQPFQEPYPMGGMLALIALAMFSGVRRGPQDLAEYAATLSQGQLRALGFRLDQHTGKVRCPGVTPFRTVLSGVEASAVERTLLLWQEQVLGPAQDKLVIVDGKTLRHAHVELVSAVNGQGRWLGTVPVQAGSNEIPAARELLGHLELAPKTTLADALHTQVQTVQQVLFQGGGDYALTVKENQKDLVQTLATLLTSGKFSPSTHDPNPRTDPGTQL